MINELDVFDKEVEKMNTIRLTNNTEEITRLPDEFEPKNDNANEIASLIP